MADEQYRWLDRDMAERLLRGEPPGTAVTARAERLARALDALTAGLEWVAGTLSVSTQLSELREEKEYLLKKEKDRADRA